MRNLNLFLMIIIIGLFIAGTVLFVNLKNIESQISASLAQLKPLSQKEKNYLLEDFVNCLTKKG
jgi:flagellar motor switch protein FliG